MRGSIYKTLHNFDQSTVDLDRSENRTTVPEKINIISHCIIDKENLPHSSFVPRGPATQRVFPLVIKLCNFWCGLYKEFLSWLHSDK